MKKTLAKFPYGLPQVISVLNLISDVFVTRVCVECGWNDDDFEYYKVNSNRIPVSDRSIINNILKDQLQYLLKNCPQLTQLQ